MLRKYAEKQHVRAQLFVLDNYDISWESGRHFQHGHRDREAIHWLLLYKMFNNLSPLYLCSLIPPTVDTQSSYNLRNAHNIRTIHSRTTQYFNSFLPSTIREWNTLPLDVRNCDSINSFKRKLNSDINVVPKYFYTGNRKAQVLHVRIRTKCSSLNMLSYWMKASGMYLHMHSHCLPY